MQKQVSKWLSLSFPSHLKNLPGFDKRVSESCELVPTSKTGLKAETWNL